jgi:hypothetical protein
MMEGWSRRTFFRSGAGFAAALTLRAPGADAQSAPGAPPQIDLSFGPRVPPLMQAQLQAWADTLKAKIAVWWPTMTAALSSPGYTPTDRVSLAFYRIDNAGVPAATRGATIDVDPWKLIVRLHNPDTFGMVAHELVHVVQAYPQGATPGWLTEGIADYMRYYVLLPDDPGRYFDPQGLTEKTGYQPTAGLLDWVERRRPGAVRRINQTMRQGGDGAATLTEIAGADPDALWRAYMASRPAAANAQAARARAAAIAS